MRLVGPLELVGIIFVILKLIGVIAWSWWWVLSPFLIGIVFGIILGIIAVGNGLSQGKSIEEIRENIMKGLGN